MHFNMGYTRKKTFNNAEMLAVLFLVLVKVVNSNNISWYKANMTVTRRSVSSDYFDIWIDKDTKECSLRIIPNVCQSYGAIEVKSNCKRSCCTRCMCEGLKPTFLVQRQQCIEDRNITQLSGKLGSLSCICKLLKCQLS